MRSPHVLLALVGFLGAPTVEAESGHSLYQSSPPIYPSPHTTGAGGWTEALSKAEAFVSKLTVEEKVMLVTGTAGSCVETQRNPVSVNGTTVEAVSADIEDRTMHEHYLWPFADAVRAGVASVMCSYNRLNGSYGCQNSKTLNGLLKNELGFQGYVMSDWMATHSGRASIQAGLDMNMPGGIQFTVPNPSYWGGNLTTAVGNGSVPEARLDDMVLRAMTPYYFLNQDIDFPLVDESSTQVHFFPKDTWIYNFTLGPIVDARANHRELIRDLSAQATVLLKNTNRALPLKAPKNIVVFGNDASDLTNGQYALSGEDPIGSEFGTMAVGGGSGSGRFSDIVSPLEALKARAANTNSVVQYVLNNTLVNQGASTSTYSISPAPVDACLIFLKAYASEGVDRPTLLSPSGRLPYTIAKSEADHAKLILDINSTESDDWHEYFEDGQLTDYKFFDCKNISVQYEFGFGLSYTTFSASQLEISVLTPNASRTPSPSAAILPGGNVELWEPVAIVTVYITNIGSINGKAVPQLYLGLGAEAGHGTPIRSLRGFDKIGLEAGESKTVNFTLLRRDVSYWDVVKQTWVIPTSGMTVYVGFSSRDLPMSTPLQI